MIQTKIHHPLLTTLTTDGRLWCFMGLCLLLTTAGGCDYFRGFADDVNVPALHKYGVPAGEIPQPRKYPSAAEIGDALEVEVIRDNQVIYLDNRTVREYANVQLWINQEFGGTLENVPIGRGDPIALKSLLNNHNESYPTAKFLQPDASQEMILAELLIDGKIHKIDARLSNNWRRLR